MCNYIPVPARIRRSGGRSCDLPATVRPDIADRSGGDSVTYADTDFDNDTDTDTVPVGGDLGRHRHNARRLRHDHAADGNARSGDEPRSDRSGDHTDAHAHP